MCFIVVMAAAAAATAKKSSIKTIDCLSSISVLLLRINPHEILCFAFV